MPITLLITILLHYLRVDFLTIPLAFLPPPFLPPLPPIPFRIRRVGGDCSRTSRYTRYKRCALLAHIYIYIYARSNQPLSRYRRFGVEVPRRRSRRSSVKRRRERGGEREEARTPQCIVTGFVVSTHLQASCRLRLPCRRLILPPQSEGRCDNKPPSCLLLP